MDMKKIVGGATGTQSAGCLREIDPLTGCLREIDPTTGAMLNCLREVDGTECANEDYQFS
jgi:hypothetical protein